MADIVNLRNARKARERADRAAQAAANRAKHGRTAAQKQAEARVRERARRTLDGARIEPSE